MGKIILGVITIAIVGICIVFGLKGCDSDGGFPWGSSGNNGTSTAVGEIISNTIDNTEGTEESVCIIKVEEDNIYVDDIEYTSAEEISEVIKKRYSEDKATKFEYVHENAIKSTNDKVKKVLLEIEDALELSINYNED